MANLERYARAVHATLDELPPASISLYWILAKDLGLSESDLSPKFVDPVSYAGHWECLWRLAPWLTDEAFGEGVFEHSSNPFLGPAIVQLGEGERATSRPEASREIATVLESAVRIERTSDWPDRPPRASTSAERRQGETTTREEFALQAMSRLILRGQVESTIASLATILPIYASGIEDESARYATFVDDIYPLFLLAYSRIRPVGQLQAFLGNADQLLRNSEWANLYGFDPQSPSGLLGLPHSQPIKRRALIVEDTLDWARDSAPYTGFEPLPKGSA